MKELEKDQLLSNRDSQEQVQKKQQETELAFLGELKPLKGHTAANIPITTSVLRSGLNLPREHACSRSLRSRE